MASEMLRLIWSFWYLGAYIMWVKLHNHVAKATNPRAVHVDLCQFSSMIYLGLHTCHSCLRRSNSSHSIPMADVPLASSVSY